MLPLVTGSSLGSLGAVSCLAFSGLSFLVPFGLLLFSQNISLGYMYIS